FWPDLDPDRGVRAFHVTMSAVRRAVEPDLERGAASSVVATEGDAYRVLLDESVTFDADEFVRLVEVGVDDPDPDAQRVSLTTALALHGGEPFPEWAYDAWVEGLRNRVQRAQVRALETLGGNMLDGARAADAVEPLSTLVELDPCLEAGHRGLMRAHHAAGERARALRQFHACRSALVREQGVEPSQETRDLYSSILGDG
ncbi:MAG: AfsR/SARP family transcriptional regulator, partial [Miltoncostaeaceae bacterium]